MKYCIKCGQQLSDDSNFCPFCGTAQPSSLTAAGEKIERSFDELEDRLVDHVDAIDANIREELDEAEEREAQEVERGIASGVNRTDEKNRIIDEKNSEMILMVISSIFAAYFAYRLIRAIWGVLTNTLAILRSGVPFFLISTFANLLMMALLFALFAVFGFRRRKTQTTELLFDIFAGAFLQLLVRILVKIIFAIFRYPYTVFGQPVWFGFLGAIALFVVLFLSGKRTILNIDPAHLGDFVSDAVNALIQAVTPTPDEQKKLQEMQAKRAAEKAQAQPAAMNVPPVQQMTPAGIPAAASGPVKANRSILAYILLTIITCGIYGLFFFYSWAKDVNTMCDGDGEHTGGLLAFVCLTVITCGIYSIIWQYKLANRLQRNGSRYGVIISDGGSTILLWIIIGVFVCGIGPIIAMHILIKNTNMIAARYNAIRFGAQQ